MKEEMKRLVAARDDTLRKISFLQHKSIIEYREVYLLIRSFFKVFLDRHYEFTIRELKKDIQSTYIPLSSRKKANSILDDLEKMEYTTASFSHRELLAILSRFEELVHELVRHKRGKQSLLSKIKEFFVKEEELIIMSEVPAVEKTDKYHVHMNVLIERVYYFMNKKKLWQAKHQYKELIKYYQEVPQDIKKEFFPLVNQTYTTLHKAISSNSQKSNK